MIRLLPVLLLLSAPARSASGDVAGALEFTRVPVSVRQQAGGSSYGTYDVFKAFSNPALLGYQGQTWEVGFSNQLEYGGAQNLWAVGAGYAGPQSESGAYGVALLASGYSMASFKEIDSQGNPTATTVAPGGMQGGVAAAYQYAFISFGGGARLASETFGLTGTNAVSRLLLDGGVDLSWRFAELGLAVRGVGPSAVAYPGSLAFGGAVRLVQFALGFEVASPMNGSAKNIGNPSNASSNLGVTAMPWPFLDLRIGLFLPSGQNVPGAEGILVRPGFTVRWRGLALDYAAAFAVRQGPGLTNMIGLNWNFGAERRPIVQAAPTFKAMFSFASKGQTLAVSQFDPQNVSAGDAAVISDMFRTEVIKQNAFDVIEKSNMDKILSEQAFQQTGCTSQECAVKLGKLLNVKYMVVGSFGKLLDQYVLSFRVVDIESGKAVYSDDEKGLSTQKEVANAITILVQRLTAAVAKPQ